MINLGEHISIFGMTGSGKSTLTRKISDNFPRRIIFDRLVEWENLPGGTRFASTFEEFKNIYRDVYNLDAFTIIITPSAGASSDLLVGLTDNILSLVYQVESYDARGLAIIFEEVWLYAPLHSIPAWFQETLLTGRHNRISIIGNSQRPASVSKTLISQSRHVFVGQFYEARDRKYFEETFGRIAELDNPPNKFEFWWFKTGEKPILISTL